MLKTEEYYNNIKPRDYIHAEVMDDGIMKIKGFLVIGKDDTYFYGIRLTPKNMSQNENYHMCEHMCKNMFYYYRINTIFKISKEDILKKVTAFPRSAYIEILNTMAKECKSYEHIDFSSAKFPLSDNSIILRNGELYLTVFKKSNKNVIVKLKEDENVKNGICLKGSKYSICPDEVTKLNNEDNNYVVITKVPKTELQLSKESSIEKYNFGDVVSIKKNNTQVIFLTKVRNEVYYADFIQLDFFTGIDKIPKDKVGGFCRKLDDNELGKLISRMEKPLSNDKYPIYSEAKEDILGKVKMLKNNS